MKVSDLRCTICGRAAYADERIGYTCGAPLPAVFRAMTDAEIVADWARLRRGLPADKMSRGRCLGILLDNPPISCAAMLKAREP